VLIAYAISKNPADVHGKKKRIIKEIILNTRECNQLNVFLQSGINLKTAVNPQISQIKTMK